LKKLILENIKEAFISIKSNMLRAIITIIIIALGIMLLVGILTATDSIKNSIDSDFARMGANSFSIRNKGLRFHGGGGEENQKIYPAINFDEAVFFKNKYKFPDSYVSISSVVNNTVTLKYNSEKTNPNIKLIGADENYVPLSGFDIYLGRNFSKNENFGLSNVVIIGYELYKSLFKGYQNPLDKMISVGNIKYKVIGVLKSKGSSFGFNSDRDCIIPLNQSRQFLDNESSNFTINVMLNKAEMVEPSIGKATSIFRNIRKLKIKEDDDFEIIRSNSISQMLLENIKYVTISASIIGFITLLGASIALMNIMLVSVSERTREIGIKKAIGATNNMIKLQFLTEAVIVSLIGGILGIIGGIFIGNIIKVLLDTPFLIPWNWILSGFLLCFIVGVLSGLFPAIKASKLNPIDALRYE